MSRYWATDIHLDHARDPARARFLEQLHRDAPESLLITGDISVAGQFARDLIEVADAARCPVWYVLGNHDHYGAGVGEVRDRATALADARPDIRWLPPAGVVTLADGTVLVGVDGWADGRFGDPLTTPLVLNDDRRISELAAQESRLAKLTVKRALADADAARLATLLGRAAEIGSRLLVATHVPPFREALPPRGRLAHPAWWPILLCQATGRVLQRFAADHPGHDVTVLAGHTHVECQATLAPNLRVHVGAARYGAPEARRLD
ncbi:MAG: metallophosphoesterase [Gemmatimonadota bacterium]